MVFFEKDLTLELLQINKKLKKHLIFNKLCFGRFFRFVLGWFLYF
jgi:hypothetical protein